MDYFLKWTEVVATPKRQDTTLEVPVLDNMGQEVSLHRSKRRVGRIQENPQYQEGQTDIIPSADRW